MKTATKLVLGSAAALLLVLLVKDEAKPAAPPLPAAKNPPPDGDATDTTGHQPGMHRSSSTPSPGGTPSPDGTPSPGGGTPGILPTQYANQMAALLALDPLSPDVRHRATQASVDEMRRLATLIEGLGFMQATANLRGRADYVESVLKTAAAPGPAPKVKMNVIAACGTASNRCRLLNAPNGVPIDDPIAPLRVRVTAREGDWAHVEVPVDPAPGERKRLGVVPWASLRFA